MNLDPDFKSVGNRFSYIKILHICILCFIAICIGFIINANIKGIVLRENRLKSFKLYLFKSPFCARIVIERFPMLFTCQSKFRHLPMSTITSWLVLLVSCTFLVYTTLSINSLVIH